MRDAEEDMCWQANKWHLFQPSHWLKCNFICLFCSCFFCVQKKHISISIRFNILITLRTFDFATYRYCNWLKAVVKKLTESEQRQKSERIVHRNFTWKLNFCCTDRQLHCMHALVWRDWRWEPNRMKSFVCVNHILYIHVYFMQHSNICTLL